MYIIYLPPPWASSMFIGINMKDNVSPVSLSNITLARLKFSYSYINNLIIKNSDITETRFNHLKELKKFIFNDTTVNTGKFFEGKTVVLSLAHEGYKYEPASINTSSYDGDARYLELFNLEIEQNQIQLIFKTLKEAISDNVAMRYTTPGITTKREYSAFVSEAVKENGLDALVLYEIGATAVAVVDLVRVIIARGSVSPDVVIEWKADPIIKALIQYDNQP